MIKHPKSAFFAFLSVLLFLSIIALSFHKNIPSFDFSENAPPFLIFAIFCLFVLLVAGIFFFSDGKIREGLRNIFLFSFPSALAILGESLWKDQLPYGLYLVTEIYFFSLGFFLILGKKKILFNQKQKNETALGIIKKWLKEQKKLSLALVVLIFGLNLSFGLYHIQKFAAVDEPLWLFGRISKYWEGWEEKNWKKTSVSDKPGITVSIISGVGLLWDNPIRYEPITWQGKFIPGAKNNYEALFSHFRFPILIFTSLSLFVFYFFLERVFGQFTGVSGVAFIGLSPILLGISTIVNPDSILWVFTSFSLLSFFAYLKRKSQIFLFLAGIFLGLGILTKYVANILIVFFFGMIFLEYIFSKKDPAESYFADSFFDYLKTIFLAIFTFWLFCPATWLRPSLFLESTFLSQAFKPVIWPFLAILTIFVADIFLLKKYFSLKIAAYLRKNRVRLKNIFLFIFVASIFLVFANIYSGMKFIDFENFLSSPKSAFKNDWKFFPLKTFLSNFYPLIFAVSPLAIASFLGGIFFSLNRKEKEISDTFRFSLYLLVFILLYYLGSSITGVASVIRYQVVIYPIFLIISAFFLAELVLSFNFLKKIGSFRIYAILVFFASSSLWQIAPLYSGYASFLLPKKYFLDVKDMGSGSYESAQFLNSLPESKKLNIWTDKSGVCYFFQGNCYSGFSTPDISSEDLDFLVLSSGRENRTVRMSKSLRTSLMDFGKYYARNDLAEFSLLIDNRPSQYVKVINLKKHLYENK